MIGGIFILIFNKKYEKEGKRHEKVCWNKSN